MLHVARDFKHYAFTRMSSNTVVASFVTQCVVYVSVPFTELHKPYCVCCGMKIHCLPTNYNKGFGNISQLMVSF